MRGKLARLWQDSEVSSGEANLHYAQDPRAASTEKLVCHAGLEPARAASIRGAVGSPAPLAPWARP